MAAAWRIYRHSSVSLSAGAGGAAGHAGESCLWHITSKLMVNLKLSGVFLFGSSHESSYCHSRASPPLATFRTAQSETSSSESESLLAAGTDNFLVYLILVLSDLVSNVPPLAVFDYWSLVPGRHSDASASESGPNLKTRTCQLEGGPALADSDL